MEPLIRIAVMGGGGVGKSTLTVKYVQRIFIDKYDPTIEDSYRKSVIIFNKAYTLEILDTAGTEQFTSMRDLYIKNSDGFILVYSITSQTSLIELEDIYSTILRVKDDIPQIPSIMICGTKCDLESDRVVDIEVGQSKAQEYKAGFMEVSSKTNINVDDCFHKLCELIILNKQENCDKIEKKRRCVLV